MTRPTSAAVFGLALAALVSSEASAQTFETFASPMIFVEIDEDPKNVTCYFSNVSSKSIRVKDHRLYGWNDTPSGLNTCGQGSGFDLAPGTTCFNTTQMTLEGDRGCAALVSDGKGMRGSIEIRDQNHKVLRSGVLTVGAPPKPGGGLQTIASPAMFGSSQQGIGACVFSNIGTKNVKMKDPRIVGPGGVLPSFNDTCVRFDAPSGSAFVLQPGRSCVVEVRMPQSDVQCLASTSNPANIRGSMTIYRGAFQEVLNLQAVQ